MAKANEKPGERVQPATLADVARHAGVAPMTVSRVVNGVKWVKSETRERVLASVAALKYMPNQEARRLAGAEATRVGVLYSNPSAGYLSEFLIGLLKEASRCQVHLMVEWVDPQLGAESVACFLASGLEAVIISAPLSDSAVLQDMVASNGLRAVLIAPHAVDQRFNAITVDHYGASASMTRHLISLGHRRIGFITGRSSHSATGYRLAGFRDAMREAGLELPDELVVQGEFTYSSGLDAAEELLSLQTRPTAIYASNDDMAAATISVAHRLGIDVPGDLTVVGCDDSPIATTIWPELTTIRQPIRMMASTAVELLARQLKADRAGHPIESEAIAMGFEIVRRQSDATPRRRSLLSTKQVVRTGETR